MSIGSSGRSGIVTAVAIVNYIVGALNLACGAIAVCGGGVLAGVMGSDAVKQAQNDPNLDAKSREAIQALGTVGGGVLIVIGVIAMIMAVPLIIGGYGVQRRQAWGRILTIILGGIMVLLALFALVNMNIPNFILNGAYAGFVLAVMLNPKFAREFN